MSQTSSLQLTHIYGSRCHLLFVLKASVLCSHSRCFQLLLSSVLISLRVVSCGLLYVCVCSYVCDCYSAFVENSSSIRNELTCRCSVLDSSSTSTCVCVVQMHTQAHTHTHTHVQTPTHTFWGKLVTSHSRNKVLRFYLRLLSLYSCLKNKRTLFCSNSNCNRSCVPPKKMKM
jgi:hypothetical protein